MRESFAHNYKFVNSGNKIERKADITAGLVPIYHLGEDTYVDENGDRLNIKGSEGLTLNLAISARYAAGESLYFNVFYGSPLVTREVQPAGLARSYAGGLSVGFRF